MVLPARKTSSLNETLRWMFVGVTLRRKRRVTRQVESCYYPMSSSCCLSACLRQYLRDHSPAALCLLLHLIPCIVLLIEHVLIKRRLIVEVKEWLSCFKQIKNTEHLKCRETLRITNTEAVATREYECETSN